MDSLQDNSARVEALSGLSRYRVGLHACFTRRGAALFDLADARRSTDSALPEGER